MKDIPIPLEKERSPFLQSVREVIRTRGLAYKTESLVAELMYGCGLRTSEAIKLRVKDIDFGMNVIIVRNSKGNKDRATVLPTKLRDPLRAQLEFVAAQHRQDEINGVGEVYLPYAIERKSGRLPP
ncbi:MAG: tyrosine-type recombinase/integrase [Exilibacterium sp.]